MKSVHKSNNQIPRFFLITSPILLLFSTAIMFIFLVKLLKTEMGYLLGFLFYYSIWCVIFPYLYLRKNDFFSLFQEENSLFANPKDNKFIIFLMFLIVSISFFMYFIPELSLEIKKEPINILLIFFLASIQALINGTCEEIYWRGLFIKTFPNSKFWGFLFPAVGFALWHFSPQLVYPTKIGEVAFVISTLFLGLSFNWIAYKTKSIKWPVIIHVMISFFALGKPHATIIYNLLFT